MIAIDENKLRALEKNMRHVLSTAPDGTDRNSSITLINGDNASGKGTLFKNLGIDTLTESGNDGILDVEQVSRTMSMWLGLLMRLVAVG